MASLQTRLGDHETARDTALAAVRACRDSGNRANEANILRTLALTELNGGLLDEAEASVTQALALARETEFRVSQADALQVLAAVHHAKNHHDEAQATYVEALGIYAQLGHLRAHTSTLNHLGMLVRERDPLSARRMHVLALRAARAIGHTALEARAWEGIGRAFVASGDIDRGIPRLRRAAAVYDRIGNHDKRAVEALLISLEDDDHGGTRR